MNALICTQQPVQAITFDVGGTLIEPWPSVGHVYAEVAARFGVGQIAPETLTQNFVRAWKAQSSFDYAEESWFAIVRETFGEHAAQLPPAFYPAVYHRFVDTDVWHVYEDVLPTLAALKARGMKLGVISNWDARLRPLLANLSLSRHFSSIVISCEIGATKPDARLFARAAAELGVAPGELLHVGDSVEADVRGAERFGATGRQIFRGRAVTEPWQIKSLKDLGVV